MKVDKKCINSKYILNISNAFTMNSFTWTITARLTLRRNSCPEFSFYHVVVLSSFFLLFLRSVGLAVIVFVFLFLAD